MHLLRHVLARTEEPIALIAIWEEGEIGGEHVVNASSVDADDIEDFDRLEAFLLNPALLSADFTSEIPENRPTRLQLLLGGADQAPARVLGDRLGRRVATPVKVRNSRLNQPGSRVLRARNRGSRNPGNRLCPCGSGRKVKRCCGRKASKR